MPCAHYSSLSIATQNMHRFAHEALSLLAEVLESDVRERKAKL
jgi:hypothetical protein